VAEEVKDVIEEKIAEKPVIPIVSWDVSEAIPIKQFMNCLT
jgi:hypothetical protein